MTDAKPKKRGCFRTGCLTVAVLFVLLAGGIWLTSFWGDRLPGRFVLRVPVTGQIEERAPEPGLLPLGSSGGPLALEELVAILDRARTDKRVDSVLLDINGLQASWAKIQELSTSIDALRKSGKKVTAYLHSPDDRDYLLATACDSIIMQKDSWMLLDGLKAELFFFADPLKKLGIGFQAAQWKKYKSAVEPYTRSSPSAESLQEINALLDDSWGWYLEEVARRRRVGREAFREAIDSVAVLKPEEALQRRLIDRVLSGRQLEKEFEKRFGKPVDELLVDGRSYLSGTGGLQAHGLGERIAIIA
ncbi:MAG: S49 family peptidase, partial [Chlorobiaceae bacterium]|nr:S49 family peptidase [Chlorobiaceae bacterium]